MSDDFPEEIPPEDIPEDLPPIEEPTGEAPPPPEPEPEPEPEPAPAYKGRDPMRPLTFRHWSRPTTLQYKYLYDYRHNYYDDVIDYLDNRSRGIKKDIPRPQTWAERALRNYAQPVKTAAYAQRQKDVELLNNIRASNFSYQYHSKDFLLRKYPTLAL